MRGDAAAENLEVLAARQQTRAREQQVVIVGGEPLEQPQQARIVLPLQVIGHKCRGLDALDVPGVEILVAAQTEKTAIGFSRLTHARTRQVVARTQQGRGGAVLEPAVALPYCRDKEDITVHGRFDAPAATSPETDLTLAQPLQVAREARRIHCPAAGDGDFMLHTPRAKARKNKLAHFHRVIDQFVVVRRCVGAETMVRSAASAHSRRHAPVPVARAFRRGDLHLAAPVFQADRTQKYAGPVEETVRSVQVCTAHRQIPRVHLHAHAERSGNACRTPGVLVEFFKGNRPPAGACLDGNDVACKVPHQVAAGDPCRQCKFLAQGVRIRDRATDLEKMRFG